MSISEGEEEYNIKLGNKIFPLDKETLTASGRKGKFSLPPDGPTAAIPISIKIKGEDGDGDPYKFNPYHKILYQYDEAERSRVPEYTGDFKYDEEIPYEKQEGGRHAWGNTSADTPNGILISELESFMRDLGYEKRGYRALGGGSKKKKKSRKRKSRKRKSRKRKTRKRKSRKRVINLGK